MSSELMRDHGVLDDANAHNYAAAPTLTVAGPDGFSRSLGDVLIDMSLEQRTCECVLWGWDGTLGRMVVIDSRTVVLSPEPSP